MTLHKAKGLEFPHVFLPAFKAGIIPSTYADLDEERRLAYVALTRGMRQVRSPGRFIAAAQPSLRPSSTRYRKSLASFCPTSTQGASRQEPAPGFAMSPAACVSADDAERING